MGCKPSNKDLIGSYAAVHYLNWEKEKSSINDGCSYNLRESESLIQKRHGTINERKNLQSSTTTPQFFLGGGRGGEYIRQYVFARKYIWRLFFKKNNERDMIQSKQSLYQRFSPYYPHRWWKLGPCTGPNYIRKIPQYIFVQYVWLQQFDRPLD